MSQSNGSSSRRTFLRLATLLLPADTLPGSLPDIRTAARPRKLYLAGPNVFRIDTVAHDRTLEALCAHYGFEGLYPLNNALPKQLAELREQAVWIYRVNVSLIERAGVVLASLNFSHGAEPSSGTTFKVGYAAVPNEPIYGYVDGTGSYAGRVHRYAPELVGEDPAHDRGGMALEKFGLPLSLMLAILGRIIVSDAEQALRQLAEQSRG